MANFATIDAVVEVGCSGNSDSSNPVPSHLRYEMRALAESPKTARGWFAVNTTWVNETSGVAYHSFSRCVTLTNIRDWCIAILKAGDNREW